MVPTHDPMLTSLFGAKPRQTMRSPFGIGSFASRASAMDMASQFAGRTQSLIEVTDSSLQFIERFDAMLSGDHPMSGNSAEDLEIRKANHEDRIAAERLNLDIQAAHLGAAFSVTAPTYAEAEHGTLSHVAYEVRHPKYVLPLSMDADGIMTRYGPHGEAERPQGQRIDRAV